VDDSVCVHKAIACTPELNVALRAFCIVFEPRNLIGKLIWGAAGEPQAPKRDCLLVLADTKTGRPWSKTAHHAYEVATG
jgi:hypothetical protein